MKLILNMDKNFHLLNFLKIKKPIKQLYKFGVHFRTLFFIYKNLFIYKKYVPKSTSIF